MITQSCAQAHPPWTRNADTSGHDTRVTHAQGSIRRAQLQNQAGHGRIGGGWIGGLQERVADSLAEVGELLAQLGLWRHSGWLQPSRESFQVKAAPPHQERHAVLL